MEKFAHQLNELHVKQVENMGNKLFLTGRETACFATFLNPNLFTFFQKRLYKSVLLALQRSSDTSWENLDDYYDIVYEFNEKILPDYQDVLAVRNNLISQQKYFPDNHNLILIQDIFYVTFLKGSYLTIVHSESDELEEFEDRFEDVFKQLDPLKFSKYIAILKKFIDQHSLKIDDPRLAFTVSSSKIRLSFIINSRYCFNIYKLAEKTTFGFIYKSSLTNGQGYFVKSGKQEAFWNEVETIDTYVDHVFEGCAIELGRNRNSPYRKSNNAEFMALLFDKFRKPAMKSALNTILFGPPGTGKTYHTIDLAVKIAEPYQYQENNHEANKQIFDRLVIENRINFCTFHQSMSYEDFVEGLKPESDEETEQISYQVQSGIFKSISTRASSANKIGLNFDQAYDSLLREISGQGKIAIYETLARSREFTARVNRNNNIAVTPNTGKGTEMTITKESLKAFLETGEESDWPSYLKPFAHRMRNVHGYTSKENTNPEPYVLIIDEINRGNVSQIFGELITLLESDKREGKANALSVTLPYSKEKFSVPSNLYLIGTMNTADRSVEALDAALRRRFHFVEMPPRYDLVELQTIVAGSTLAQLLQTINDRMEKLLDKDHTLGHAYFLGVKNEEDLKNVFQEKIIPLLQEYFFGDIGKIGLVLGNSFIRSDERSFVGFAEFEYEDTSVVEDIKLRKVYKVSNPSEWRLDAIVGNPASNE
jgi:5-methylcytosine-specific restriction protein B